MSLKHTIIPVLLVFLLTASLSLGQDADNTSIESAVAPENIAEPVDEAATADAASTENVTAETEEATAVNETEAQPAEATAASLQYIWSITGIEPEQVTMALNQEGQDLYGQAKFEPENGEPWNAVVIGSVLGDKVDLVITALKGETLVSTKLTGTFANEAINGQFFQVSDGSIGNRGDFSAMWINPDISSYAPAVIAQSKPEPASEPTQTENVSTPATESETTTPTTQQPVQLGKSTRFVDVRKYKDQIGPGGDLSGVPPGMGGSGLN